VRNRLLCAKHILLIFVFAVFSIFATLVGAEGGGIVGIYLAIPLIASVRVIWQMCAAPETTAGHSRRHPAATTALPALLTEPALVCVGAIPAHAKAD
jgi:hypothetical protein